MVSKSTEFPVLLVILSAAGRILSRLEVGFLGAVFSKWDDRVL
jgi:hypothetical protein